MLDFDDIPPSPVTTSAGQTLTEATGAEPESSSTTDDIIILYRTRTCLEQLQEALRYEGMENIKEQLWQPEQLADLLSGTEAQLVLIETDPDFFSQPCQSLSSFRRLLPYTCQVLFTGHDDRISTLRTLGQQGFHYLLWPASRQDIVGQLRTCTSHSRHSPVRCAHSAIRIGVMAAKGGSGCTLVAADLARGLAAETLQPGIIADHGYHGSNLHIMLGKATLTGARETEAQPPGEQPEDYIEASSQLNPVSAGLSYLACRTAGYTRAVLATLAREHHFIVEDFPAGQCSFAPSSLNALAELDCLVLVIHPSLSGLCQTRRLLEHIRQNLAPNRAPGRVLLVLNQCLPGSSIDQDTARQYLNQAIAIELPWIRQCEDYLTTGRCFYHGNGRRSQPFKNLARQILGKTPITRTIGQRLLNMLTRARPGRSSE